MYLAAFAAYWNDRHHFDAAAFEPPWHAAVGSADSVSDPFLPSQRSPEKKHIYTLEIYIYIENVTKLQFERDNASRDKPTFLISFKNH